MYYIYARFFLSVLTFHLKQPQMQSIYIVVALRRVCVCAPSNVQNTRGLEALFFLFARVRIVYAREDASSVDCGKSRDDDAGEG